MSTGRSEADGYDTRYNAEAQGQLAPYRESGDQANRMYSNALGLNGRDAQSGFMSNFQSDPFRQFNEDQATKATMRGYNARGLGSGSGAAALAASRVNMERGSSEYQQYLSRLQGMQGQGLQVAGQQAGMTNALGNRMADRAYGYGQTMAGNEINYGNALAGTRNIGIQNGIKVAGTAISAATGMPMGMGGGGGGQVGGMSPGGVSAGGSWGSPGGGGAWSNPDTRARWSNLS